MMKNRCLATLLLCLTIHSGRSVIFDKDDLTSLNSNLASLTQNLDMGSLVEFGVKTLLPSLVSHVHKINKREADGSQTSMADKLGISIVQEEFVREGEPTGNTIVINIDNLQKLYIIPGIHQAQLNISYFHGVNETASELVVQTSFLVHTSKGPESGNILYQGYKPNPSYEETLTGEDLLNSLHDTRWKYSVSSSFDCRYLKYIMPKIVAQTSASLVGNQLKVTVSNHLGHDYNLLVNGIHAPGISYNFAFDCCPYKNYGPQINYAGNFSVAMQERGMPIRYHITGKDFEYLIFTGIDLNLAGIIKTNLMEGTIAGSTKIALGRKVFTVEIGGEFDFARLFGEVKVNLKSDEEDFKGKKTGIKLLIQGQSQSAWTANFEATYTDVNIANVAFGMDLLKSRYSLNASMADGYKSEVTANNTVNLIVDVLQGRYVAVVGTPLHYYGFDLKGAQLKPDNKGILTIYLGRNGEMTADWDVKVALPDFNLNLVKKWNNHNAFHLNINNTKLDWNSDPRTIEGNLVIDVGVGEDKVKLEVDRYAKNGTYCAIKFERWLSTQPVGPWITLESTDPKNDLTFGVKIERILDVLEIPLHPRSHPFQKMVNNLRFSVGNVDTTNITYKRTLYAKFDMDAKEIGKFNNEYTYPYHIAVSTRRDLSENITLDLKLGRRVNVTANVYGLTSRDITFLGSVNNGWFHFEAHVGAGQGQRHPNVTFDMFDQAENHMLVEMINHPGLVDSRSDVHYEISYSDDFEYFPSGKASLVTDRDDSSLVIHNKPEIGEEWDLYIAKNRANLTFRFMRDESITTSMFGTESWSYLANWDNKTTTLELGLADKSLLYPLICRFYCFKEYKEETWYERFRAFPKYIFAYRYEGKIDNRPMVLNFKSMGNTIILELGEDFKVELDKEVLAPIFVQLDIDPSYWNTYL